MEDLEHVTFEIGWAKIKDSGIQVLRDYLITGKTTEEALQLEDGSTKALLFSNDVYSELYTLVYTMATQKENYADKLYEQYKVSITDFATTVIKPALEQQAGLSDEEFLQELSSSWVKHKIFTLWLYHIFYYLDRYHVSLAGVEPLEKAARIIWVNEIYTLFEIRLRSAFCNLLECDRVAACEVPIETIEGAAYKAAVNVELLRSITEMIDSLNDLTDFYLIRLKPFIVQNTRDFYTQISSIWISTLSFPDYLKRTEKALLDEEARCKDWLCGEAQLALKKAIQTNLLSKPQDELLQMPTAIDYLLRLDMRTDLRRCFLLFSECENGLTPVASSFRAYVFQVGTQLVQAKAASMKPLTQVSTTGSKMTVSFASLAGNADVADLAFVRSLLDVHSRFKMYVEVVFGRDLKFVLALKDAYESFLNTEVGGYPMAAFLCTYCDKLIRRPANATVSLPNTQEAMEAEAQRLVDLFAYLQDKDSFAEGYRQQLARRLVGAQDPPGETERFLVARLKHECGNSFSSKLEGMLADVSSGNELKDEFANYLRQNPLREDMSFTVQVLTTGHWPSYPHYDLIVPRSVEDGMAAFRKWYDTRTAHRKLNWVNSLSQAIVSARLKRNHELVCSGFQATLLLLFNDSPDTPVPLSALGKQTGLVDQHLKKQVKCLYGKFAIIKKIENSDDPNDPLFQVNRSFTSQSRRFKLPVPMQEEVAQKDNIEQDRSIAIQASIVRIMKARKVLTHGQLVSEVLSHLKLFRPQPKDIKVSIEHLIQRDYLTRLDDQEQTNSYAYVA